MFEQARSDGLAARRRIYQHHSDPGDRAFGVEDCAGTQDLIGSLAYEDAGMVEKYCQSART